MKRLLRQFALGVVWISILAGLVSFSTQTSFWIVLPVMLGLALGGGAMALFWMARWAERDSPGGQFGIASLFLLMVYVGAFFSCVQWSLMATYRARLQRFPTAELTADLEPTLFEFAMTSLFGLVMLYVSLPIVLGLIDSVLWSAVWLLKRPRFKAVAHRVLRRPTRN